LTVAVATDVEVPFAAIEAGLKPTVATLAGPVIWVSVLAPDTAGETELSVAVMVNAPAPRVDVIVAWYVPGAAPAATGPMC
jgi:hypothetical protein